MFISSYLNRLNIIKRTPLIYSFLVTNKCQLRCRHCFYTNNLDNNSIKILSFEEYTKISKNMDSFYNGLFCGGEPFLRPDLHKIIKLFYDNNHMRFASCTTNGYSQNLIISQVKKILSESEDLKLTVWVSLDGFKKQHNFIRGSSKSFDNSISTLKKLKDLKSYYKNLFIGISSVMDYYNQKKMENFIDYSYTELKPDFFGLLLIRQNPKDPKSKDYNLEYYLKSIKNLELKIMSGNFNNKSFLSNILSIYSRHLIYKTLLTNQRQFLCRSGSDLGFIDCDGTVNLCEKFEHENMGNLRDFNYDFKKLWYSKKNIKFRKQVNNCKVCNACTHETQGIGPSLGFSFEKILKSFFYYQKTKNHIKKKIK